MPAPYTKLDANQVIKHVFEEGTDRLRVDAQVSATISDVAIADATTGDTAVVNPNGSLDVNVVNPINVNISAASGDNIAISNNSGTAFMAVNADGTINTRMSNTLVTSPYDYVGLINSTISGQTVVTTAVYKLGGASGALVATLTLAYDGSANLTSVTKS
jgi:hypothetical protein